MYVPGTEYSTNNHWEKKDTMAYDYDEDLSVNGHMPFGVTSYLHERQQKTWLEKYFFEIIVIVLVMLLLIILVALVKKKKK